MSHQCPLVGAHGADEAVEGTVRPWERHSFTLSILCVTEEQSHHYLQRVTFNTLVNVKPWADANAIRRGGKLYIKVILKHSFKRLILLSGTKEDDKYRGRWELTLLGLSAERLKFHLPNQCLCKNSTTVRLNRTKRSRYTSILSSLYIFI